MDLSRLDKLGLTSLAKKFRGELIPEMDYQVGDRVKVIPVPPMAKNITWPPWMVKMNSTCGREGEVSRISSAFVIVKFDEEVSFAYQREWIDRLA